MRELRPFEVHALRGRINGTRGAVRETAAAMGISRFQLHRLMTRYEIAVPKGEELDESP
jgi:DNA-binding NtrC family response regulator